MRTSNTIAGFDFHCHIDLHSDPEVLIAECESRKIFTLAVTTTPKAWPQNRKWTARCKFVRAAVGLHPELAGERYRETDLVKLCMRETAYVGEVGLDGSPPHRASLPKQRQVFCGILDEAEKLGGKIVSIHSRRAAAEVIDMIRQRTTPQRVATILHWFSGTERELIAGIGAKCFFSVNPAMVQSKNGRAIIGALPSECLLTETDAPFATTKGKPTYPADVLELPQKIAEIRGESTSFIRETLIQNANRIFKLGHAGT